MDEIIVKLAIGQKIDDEDIINGLYDICENVHSSCDSGCPVYKLNNNTIPDTVKDFEVNSGCDCFKNGRAMLEFIRNKNKFDK